MEKIKINFLKEENYRSQMQHVVEPYLEKYRRRVRFTGFDGTRLSCCLYVQEHARGNIVISHGFSEFAEKYNELTYYFLQAGYSVFLLEHRGHGRSERKLKNPEKIYVRSFEEYVWDFHIFVKKVVDKYPNEKILFAHSMGGAIGALYLEKYPHDFQKAVLSSPMIRMSVAGVPYRTAMHIAHVCRAVGFGRAYAAGQHGFSSRESFEQSCCLSEERHMYAFEKRLKNREYQTSGGTYSWVCAASKAAKYVQDEENINRISIPVLIFAAGREHMVDTNAICKFAAKLHNARLVWVLNAKHEIFNAGESGRMQFYDELSAFISGRRNLQ